jgi:D-beta-D-heptose 7-phosphate kinase/D-beta-D-heptose 1-phosphate adenosyltransferase
MDHQAASDTIAQWQGKRVGVLGDLMLDRYVWGGASRISQEAPIPVVEVDKVTARPGGAANVLYNIVSLGGEAHAFGVVGEDKNGEELSTLLSGLGIGTDGIIRDDGRVTTEKTRIIAAHQQIVRVDTEQKDPLEASVQGALRTKLENAITEGHIDALIIEDYAKGTLNKVLAQQVVACATKHGLPVALDPHPANHLDLSGLTLMTPNRSEAFVLAGKYMTHSVLPIESDAALLDVVAHPVKRGKYNIYSSRLGVMGWRYFSRKAIPFMYPRRRVRSLTYPALAIR